MSQIRDPVLLVGSYETSFFIKFPLNLHASPIPSYSFDYTNLAYPNYLTISLITLFFFFAFVLVNWFLLKAAFPTEAGSLFTTSF